MNWSQLGARATRKLEAGAAQLWSSTLRKPLVLRLAGGWLRAVSAARGRSTETLDRMWAQGRLASARDAERIDARIDELEATIERLTASIATSGAALDARDGDKREEAPRAG